METEEQRKARLKLETGYDYVFTQIMENWHEVFGATSPMKPRSIPTITGKIRKIKEG